MSLEQVDGRGDQPLADRASLEDAARFLREARARVDGFEQRTERQGSRSTRLYTAAVDNTLRRLFEGFDSSGELPKDWLADSVCVVATGGYGRKMLCPHSDVDLILISGQPADENLARFSRHLLYPLWDAGLDVGCRPGSIAEILDAAETDITARTALLDLRLVAGSTALYGRVLDAVESAFLRWGPDLLAAVRGENLVRFQRYGESVFLLEPQVKEGKGGMRDFHWLLWVARLRHGARGDYDLLLNGLVEPEHYRAMVQAYEFLLRVRVQLHLHTGRREDRLLFDHQEPVARAMGFKASRGLMAVERFMGAYYAHAYALAHNCGLYVARMLGFYWDEPQSETGQEGPRGPLLVGPSAPISRTQGDEERVSEDGLFLLKDGSVRCLRPEVLRKTPDTILGLFEFLQVVGGRLHHDTTEQVRSVLPRVNRSFQRDPDLGARFRGILEGQDVFRTLVAMHRSGFLGRYIPEFGACFCQAQHNRVHLYTVDVHCLYVVRELEGLAGSGRTQEAPLFARAWRERERRGPLLLAGLLHDIAKAHGTAHSRVGAEMARAILERLGYETSDVARAEWLVRHHLLLSEIAYHRDLLDPATQESLAAVIPDQDHLDELLALTWADTRATNPSLMTSWKRALLEQTYAAARSTLEAGSVRSRKARQGTAALRARVEAVLGAEFSRREVPRILARLLDPDLVPEGYLSRHPAEELATHAALLEAVLASEGSVPFTSHERLLESHGVSQWIVCTRDRVGLFGMLAGTLSACGLNIVAAETVTRGDGICLDRFSVVDGQGRPVDDNGRWRRVKRMLTRVLTEEDYDLGQALAPVRAAHRSGKVSSRKGQRVAVRNDVSEQATVIEVVTADRPALVYDITQVLSGFGLDLRVAKIATRDDLASDTFYVVGRGGQKVGQRRCRQLGRALEGAFL